MYFILVITLILSGFLIFISFDEYIGSFKVFLSSSIGFLVSIMLLIYLNLCMQPTFTKKVYKVEIVNNVAVLSYNEKLINLNQFCKRNFNDQDLVEVITPNHTFFTDRTCKELEIRVVSEDEDTNNE